MWNEGASRDERFIGFVNALLPLCQPFHEDDVSDLERFARIGVGSGEPFDADALDDATREAIRAGVGEARGAIEAKIGDLGRKVNGWAVVEVFGDRSWYDGDHLLRAAGAMAGWGGNDVSEVSYPTAREDSDGEPLSGDHRLPDRAGEPAPCVGLLVVHDLRHLL